MWPISSVLECHSDSCVMQSRRPQFKARGLRPPTRARSQAAGATARAAQVTARRIADAGWDNASLQQAVNMAVERAPAARSDGELKGMDTILPHTDGNWPNDTVDNSHIWPVNLLTAGAGSYERVGRKISMKSLRIFVHFVWQTSFDADANPPDLHGTAYRICVVYDKQPSGVTPSFGDIFGTTNSSGATGHNIFDNLRYSNTERFRVLRDIRRAPGKQPFVPVIANGKTYVHETMEDFIPLNGLETVYSGTTSPPTIADVSSGALYVIVRAESDTATCSVNHNYAFTRLRYYD